MRKIQNLIFIIIFTSMLIIPPLQANLKQGAISLNENRYLADYSLINEEGLSKGMEDYLKDRIGFRGEMIFLYQELSDICFNEYVGQMYGEEGYTFIVTNHEIEDWQRQNVDYEYIGKAANYYKNIQNYLEKRGIPFLLFIPTSKEEIYGEYFPKTINQDSSKKSRMETFLEALDILEVPYVYTKDHFLKMKEKKQLYARKYDPAHWNENGAFEGIKLLFEALNERYPELALPGISEELYDITEKEQKTQLNSSWIINDTLPVYKPKKVNYYAVPSESDWNIEYETYYSHYLNPLKGGSQKANSINSVKSIQEEGKKLLMFNDSYLMGKEYLFADNFKELVFLSNVNLWNLSYYLDIISPDLVIVESVQWGIIHRNYPEN